MSYLFFSRSKNALSIVLGLLIIFSQGNASEQAKSFNIDYKESSSDLCLIGAGYDTDRSHCHPYTLFYDSLFKDKRNEDLVIAEMGILYGSSLLMWRDYFVNATICGFEYNKSLIDSFQRKYNNDRINLFQVNVQDDASIAEALHSTGMQYDLIIDDTMHRFEDQLRVIENALHFLKPGGMLIIENIFKKYKEQDYIDRLQPILDNFQDYYFVSLDHKNKCSIGGDSDKLFVLVKAGGDPIFKNKKKMTIITPSMRPSNLLRIKETINFNYVDEWIIVYDGKKIAENPQIFIHEGNPKIKEYIHTSEGISGNPQRNYALDHIENEDTYLYFLDDDNLIHEDLYKLLDIIGDKKIVTFDQKNRLKGDNIKLSQIDTAMLLIDFQLCKTTRWRLNVYAADFYYINECYSKNKDKWIYVNNELCTYNLLRRKN